MLHKLRRRAGEEQGFTLIELLVVMLIIGILAAIALPVFLNQQDKGYNASAKSNVRNLVSHVEACATDKGGDYSACQSSAATELGTKTGLPLGAPGAPTSEKVTVVSSDANGFVVAALSKSGDGFSIKKDTTGFFRCKGLTGGCSANEW